MLTESLQFSKLSRLFQMLEVNTSSPADRLNGRTFNYLLLTLIPVVLILMLLMFNHVLSAGLAFMVIVSSALLPSFIIVKSGRVQTACWYFLGVYSLTVCGAAFAALSGDSSLSTLMECVTALDFTVVAAALLIHPRAALLMGMLNVLFTVGLYWLTRMAWPPLSDGSTIWPILAAPIFNEILLAVACALLAHFLYDMMRQNNRLRQILEVLPIGVAVHDVSLNRSLFVNAPFERLAGKPDKDAHNMLKRTPWEIVTDTLDAPEVATVDDISWQHKPISAAPLSHRSEITHPDGRVVTIEEITVPIYDDIERQKLSAIVQVVLDVTLYRELQQRTEQILDERRAKAQQEEQTITRLRELDRLKSEFLASMGHEFQTPLSTIISCADLILNGKSTQEQVMGDAHRIYTAGRHLHDLLGHILDMSRIDAGTMGLTLKNVNLCEILKSAADLLRGQIEAKSLKLILDLPDQAVWIAGDSTRLAQIVINLLNNAYKFTQVGTITLRLWLENSHAYIAVEDTGQGIPPEQHDAVFERFYQIGRAAARKREGIGLGLSITRTLVEMHHGTIALKSIPGQGATFTFSLPLTPQAASGARSDSSTAKI